MRGGLAERRQPSVTSQLTVTRSQVVSEPVVHALGYAAAAERDETFAKQGVIVVVGGGCWWWSLVAVVVVVGWWWSSSSCGLLHQTTQRTI